MSLFKTFETDKQLQEEGVWFEVEPGVRFLCGRMTSANKRYQRELERTMKPYKTQYTAGTLDNDLAESLLKDVFIKSCLLDWIGVTDREGVSIDLDYNNARWLFDELPDLYLTLKGESERAANYLIQEMEEMGKSSRSMPAGSSVTELGKTGSGS